ncbi:MAG: RnfABCDGE type electron transport complex subunit D [Candidatus Sericytochromatia bacterium]|nr:RnfABCDGE type electron transport complex subunit D [Candidatus Tanganyikabacteria bacterium]
MSAPHLVVTASPHLAGKLTTPGVMWQVVLSLAPVVAAATYFFGISALLVIAASIAGAAATEAAFGRRGTLRDGSAVVCGILLGLTLPAGLPLWMAFVGAVFGIGVGKAVFGGLGQNPFNPALLGRAFLQAAFPVAITTFPPPGGRAWWHLAGDNFALPLMRSGVDAITAATPLGLMKFERQGTELWALAIGNTGGSLGETAGIVIVVCGAYLVWRGLMNWRIPASILLTVALFAGALNLLAPDKFPGAPFMLLSGGLLLGAIFMATDPVTSPTTGRGCWLFGIGIGLLVVIIRLWGGLNEGVMYAILLMNALVPFIERISQPVPFGKAAARPAGKQS